MAHRISDCCAALGISPCTDQEKVDDDQMDLNFGRSREALLSSSIEALPRHYKGKSTANAARPSGIKTEHTTKCIERTCICKREPDPASKLTVCTLVGTIEAVIQSSVRTGSG